ncbi:carboxymuconolactone decarboxylase family protein [Dickeya dadantii]|uniref:carboxymuconolactone decarboxylase family protein n=1 Tax=Dickeya dadantii TaxID=204038 RepID=UPI003015DC24
MTYLTLHTIETAPEASKALLQSSIDNFGWIPNQSAYMAESPALLSAYQYAHELFSHCSLNEQERAIVWITVGINNRCVYTVQAHRWIALHNGVPAELIWQLEYQPETLPPRLAALHAFTRIVIQAQGQLKADAIDTFLSAGFSRQNMLDVILGVAQKTMSTLLNSIAGTSIERQFLDTEE